MILPQVTDAGRQQHARSRSLAIASGAALVALLCTLALATAGFLRATTATHGAGGDFLSFYAAGDIVRHGGAGLYSASMQEAAQRALYPGTLEHATGYPLPVFAAWLFAPLSILPFGAAFAVWGAINVAILTALSVALYRFLSPVRALVRRVFVVAFALSMPAVTNIVFGQVDLIIFAAMLGAYVLLQRERPLAAGAVLAVVLIKPQFLIGILPMLLMGQQWRALLALAAVGVPLLVLPALLASPDALLANVSFIGHYPGASGGDLQVNASMMSNWRGFIVSATGRSDVWLWLPGQALLAVAAFVVAARRWRPGADPAQAYSMAVMLPVLASPHLHTQSLVLIFLPIALALRADAPTRESTGASDQWILLLLTLYSALFALWLCTALGLAPVVFLVATMFAACAWRWPYPLAVAAAELEVGTVRQVFRLAG